MVSSDYLLPVFHSSLEMIFGKLVPCSDLILCELWFLLLDIGPQALHTNVPPDAPRADLLSFQCLHRASTFTKSCKFPCVELAGKVPSCCLLDFGRPTHFWWWDVPLVLFLDPLGRCDRDPELS